MGKKRYITLTDGTGMGGELIILKTDAPQEILKELEQRSCEIYAGGEEDVPIWYDEIRVHGYSCEIIDSYVHVTAYKRSDNWLKEHEIGKHIKEHYVIQNQM